MDVMTIEARSRDAVGTRASRKLRAEGQIPAICYGHGEAAQAVSLSRHDVEVALVHGARMIEVNLDGKPQQFLIKEVQYDHLGAHPVHLDLVRVALDERVRVRVGIELRGTPRGVAEDGVLEQIMAAVEVECLAGAIPDTIRPLVNELGVGDSLLVKDLPLPPGVTAVDDPDERVAVVRQLATAPEPTTEEVAEEAVAEPERIGRVRKEEEESAS